MHHHVDEVAGRVHMGASVRAEVLQFGPIEKVPIINRPCQLPEGAQALFRGELHCIAAQPDADVNDL